MINVLVQFSNIKLFFWIFSLQKPNTFMNVPFNIHLRVEILRINFPQLVLVENGVLVELRQPCVKEVVVNLRV